MRSLRTTAQVDAQGVLRLELATGLRPGAHRVLLMIEEHALDSPDLPPWFIAALPVIHGGTWPEGFSLSEPEPGDEHAL
jgi:hypothetical protein